MRPALWVLAVVVEGDRLLLVRGASPSGGALWSPPGAEVDADEPLAAAVVRAVAETAGLEAVCERLLGHVEHLDGDAHRVLLAFEATVLADGGLVPAATWVALDDVADRPMVDGIPELLVDRGILRLIA